ncbi:MAG: ABC transporter transmembrane domain-containing protein, partial [Planctomycetota bacterium]
MTPPDHIEEDDYTARFDWGLWKKLFQAVGQYRRQWIALCIQAVVMGVLDSFFPRMTQWVVTEVADRGPEAVFTRYIVTYAILAVLFASMVNVFILLAGKISVGVSHDVRRQAFGHLQELSFSYYDRRPAGWLIARLTSDCDRLSRTLSWGALDVIWGLCLVTAISVNMLITDWRLALPVIATVPVLLTASLAFQKRILAASRDVRKANSNITAGYSECIVGVRTTKTLVREEPNAREFAGLTEPMYRHSVRSAILSSAYIPAIMLVTSVGTGLVLWMGGPAAQANAINIGTLVMFVHFAGLISYPVLEMAR